MHAQGGEAQQRQKTRGPPGCGDAEGGRRHCLIGVCSLVQRRRDRRGDEFCDLCPGVEPCAYRGSLRTLWPGHVDPCWLSAGDRAWGRGGAALVFAPWARPPWRQLKPRLEPARKAFPYQPASWLVDPHSSSILWLIRLAMSILWLSLVISVEDACFQTSLN